jgi:hypothetical protein
LLGALAAIAACTDPHTQTDQSGNAPCVDKSCTGGDCDAGGTCDGGGGSSTGQVFDGGGDPDASPGGIDGVKDGTETDIDCGGPDAPKCAEGKSCLVDADCEVACNYAKKCIGAPSCKPHLGGDTCGVGEVPSADHESCCRTLPVTGYTDPSHPGKTVYLDKYEVTTGRVRQWIADIAAANGGVPDVRTWIAEHRPQIWSTAWDSFLPSDAEGPVITVARRLLGDPRPEDNGDVGPPGPGVILPPPTDQTRRLGTNYQFGPEVYVDLHGNNCGTFDGSYGFPTYWYPPDQQKKTGQVARPNGVGYRNETIAAEDLLDVKAMNCITNAMLAAFCAWDGGQLATDEVLDYVTDTPASLGNVSGCGVQYDNHADLLGNIFDRTVQTGGRCPPVIQINATFDSGDNLPVPGSPLNKHVYHYPDTGDQAFDKSWEISAPGRASLSPDAQGTQVDQVRIHPGDEPWVDLAGNVNEAALDMSGASFTGLFALKYRGIGYGSSRSDLNMTPIKYEDILRLQRPEAKAAYIGGRCMRFK